MIFQIFIRIFLLVAVVQKCIKTVLSRKITLAKKNKSSKVSIIIVTYNAVDYIKQCLESLTTTNYKNKEIVVVDNNSNKETKTYLEKAKKENMLDTLFFSKENLYFSGGNNKGAQLCNNNTEYLLLLNSDTEIMNPDWLQMLVDNIGTAAIISFGPAYLPFRPDGWCFLIKKDIYDQYGGINDDYKMNWGLTQLTAKIMRDGHTVKTIINPDEYVMHYGKKSHSKHTKESDFKQMSTVQVLKMFNGLQVESLKV